MFLENFGKPAYDWQVDVAKSLVLGLDTVLIVGTGAGKMMPFMMPLLVDSSKKVLVILPLNVLQQDQVSATALSDAPSRMTYVQACQFNKLGLHATAINGDTWKQKKV